MVTITTSPVMAMGMTTRTTTVMGTRMTTAMATTTTTTSAPRCCTWPPTPSRRCWRWPHWPARWAAGAGSIPWWRCFGAIVIGHWPLGMLKASARALVDATADPTLVGEVRALIESDGDAKIADLHVWQVAGATRGARQRLCSGRPAAARCRLPVRLAPLHRLRHVTVEVHRCTGAASHR